jgi:hypothetical protein
LEITIRFAQTRHTRTPLWLALRIGLDRAGDPFDHDEALAGAIARFAARRRVSAISAWARDAHRDLPAALITVGRCPACDVALDVRVHHDGLYCIDHCEPEREAGLELARMHREKRAPLT